eukprot:527432-Prorocentrum_minimum.AAC.1
MTGTLLGLDAMTGTLLGLDVMKGTLLGRACRGTWPRPGLRARRVRARSAARMWSPARSTTASAARCVCVCVCVRACVRACVCVCACVRLFVRSARLARVGCGPPLRGATQSLSPKTAASPRKATRSLSPKTAASPRKATCGDHTSTPDSSLMLTTKGLTAGLQFFTQAMPTAGDLYYSAPNPSRT